MYSALPVFLVTLLLGEQPVEDELGVLLRVVTEEGGGVDVLALTLAIVSHILAGLEPSQLAVMVETVNVLKCTEISKCV